MEKILTYLEQLDLSEIEAKLYITLLEIGPASVRDIANAIGIKRTTTYLYIEQLLQKGLLAKVVKGSHPQIAANPPEESLKVLVDKQVQSAKKVAEQLPDILQDMSTSFSGVSGVDDVEIKYYKSMDGIRKIYDEAFKAKEIRSYIKLVENDPVFPDNVAVFNNAFQKNPELKVREIFYESSSVKKEAQEIISKNGDKYLYKYMPKDMQLTSEDILIYDNKVAIIHQRGKANCNCIILQSVDYYNNSKEFFDFIWNILPEPK